VGLLVAAASIPLGHRLLLRRRAAPESRPIGLHVVLGLTTTAVCLAHAMAILPALGSPGAVAGGMLALAPGAAAFFVLFAHVGVGLQLRAPRLKTRAQKRRLHAMLAAGIATLACVHVVVLRTRAAAPSVGSSAVERLSPFARERGSRSGDWYEASVGAREP
jgi:hypothetical protein